MILGVNKGKKLFIIYHIGTTWRGDSNKYPQHMFLGVNKGKKVCLFFAIYHTGACKDS